MSRDTSASTYATIQANGLLKKLRWEVYDYLYSHGPCTQNEINSEGFGNLPTDSIKPRLAELKKMGAVKEIGKKKCNVSGREVLLWDVTSNIPDPTVLKRVKTTKKKLKIAENLMVENGIYEKYLEKLEEQE